MNFLTESTKSFKMRKQSNWKTLRYKHLFDTNVLMKRRNHRDKMRRQWNWKTVRHEHLFVTIDTNSMACEAVTIGT